MGCYSITVCTGAPHLCCKRAAPPTGLPICLRRTKRAGYSGHGLSIHATSTLPSSPGPSRGAGYEAPLRLLQTQDGKMPTQDSTLLEEPSTSGRAPTDATYTIQFTTSGDEKSGLSVPNAGIILSLIGEQGEALVQRISPVHEDPSSGSRFQRGAVDVVEFRGPDLGCIAALWIAPEAGTWRLEQVAVTVAGASPPKGVFHMFEGSETLLGDGEDLPAVELKPTRVLECDGPDDLAVAALVPRVAPPRTPQESAAARATSMREYEALKVFLLGSTAAMVGAGMLGLSLLGAPDMARGFAAGGAGGVVYLLLLQRAVDQIPGPGADAGAPWPAPRGGAPAGPGGPRVKTPPAAASFALIVGVALVVTRATQAGAAISVPPQALLAGALGFLTSKVAVFLAAFASPSGDGK